VIFGDFIQVFPGEIFNSRNIVVVHQVQHFDAHCPFVSGNQFDKLKTEEYKTQYIFVEYSIGNDIGKGEAITLSE